MSFYLWIFKYSRHSRLAGVTLQDIAVNLKKTEDVDSVLASFLELCRHPEGDHLTLPVIAALLLDDVVIHAIIHGPLVIFLQPKLVFSHAPGRWPFPGKLLVIGIWNLDLFGRQRFCHEDFSNRITLKHFTAEVDAGADRHFIFLPRSNYLRQLWKCKDVGVHFFGEFLAKLLGHIFIKGLYREREWLFSWARALSVGGRIPPDPQWRGPGRVQSEI